MNDFFVVFAHFFVFLPELVRKFFHRTVSTLIFLAHFIITYAY